jgi:hypothetical protein
MQRDDTSGEVTAPPTDDRSPTRGPRLSRRQAIGRMSAVATAGAAAWVVPEILTAKPASGARLSGPVGTGSTGGTGASVGVSTSAGTTGGTGEPQTSASTTSTGSASTGSAGAGVGTRASTSPNALAFTGLDIQRDAEVGAALVAGGWAMHHWASRAPKPAVVVDGVAEPGSTDTVH